LTCSINNNNNVARILLDYNGCDINCSMKDCLTCTSSTVCTSCETGKYLKSDQTSCVADCSNEDVGIHYIFNFKKISYFLVKNFK